MDKAKIEQIVRVLNHLIEGLDELHKMDRCSGRCGDCGDRSVCDHAASESPEAHEAPAKDDLLRTIETEHGDTGRMTRVEVKRGTAAIEALRVINGARQNTYGNPEDSFLDISNLWSAYSEVGFNSIDVAIMMALLKIARMKNHGVEHRDNFVDAIGYLALAADMVANDHADNASSDAVDDD